MKKLISFVFVCILLVSGLNAAATISQNTEENKIQRNTTHLNISSVQIKEKQDMISVSLAEQTSYLMSGGKPMLPVISETYSFPAGTKLEEVTVISQYKEHVLSTTIEPAPYPLPLNKELIKQYSADTQPDPKIYQQDSFYPKDTYSVHKGVGLENNEHVIFVTVKAYCQYNPMKNILKTPTEITIDIAYTPPTEQVFSGNGYDMLIVTDERFVDQLQPLIDHKNERGITTTIDTMQHISQSYDGRDDAESLKLRIQDAIEEWDITYVLLVGGHIGQTNEWYIPARYSRNFDGAYSESGVPYDPKYVSDLYYADIYRYDKSGSPIFEDWDSNKNGVFGEFNAIGTGGIDTIDFYPDVYVGRLPVRYSWEVDTMVNKIITYETSTDESWFKKAIVAGGDTSAPARGAPAGTYEGELSTSLTADYLQGAGFEVTKLFTSDGTFSETDDFINAVSEGAGMIHVAGHGSPSVWGNFLPDAQTEEEFVYGFTIMDMRRFDNQEKLPILNIGGCHNGQFNVTMQHIFDHGGLAFERAGFGEWVPHDTCSWFLLEPEGGSIVSIGNTALGYGYINQYTLNGLGGWLNPRLFHAYAVQGKENIGDCHGQAIVDYINKLGSFIDDVNADSIDRKTIEAWALLGDPSLKIGGYNISPEEEDNTINDTPTTSTLGLVDTPAWSEGMSWTYQVNALDINLTEVTGRSIIAAFETGNIQLTVTEVTSDEYITSLTTDNIEVYLDLDIDLQVEGKNPIRGTGKLVNASLLGGIIFEKSTLAIKSVDMQLNGAIETESILKNVNFSVPSFILTLFPEIPITCNIKAAFSNPYELIKYPLSLDKEWYLNENVVTIEGTIESPYFRLISLADKIARIFGIQILPPSIAQYFPVIDLVEVLSDYNMSNEFELPEVKEIFRKQPFICKTEQQREIPAGEYTGYNIWFLNGAGELFYAPETNTMARIHGNIKDFIPIVDNITMELVEINR